MKVAIPGWKFISIGNKEQVLSCRQMMVAGTEVNRKTLAPFHNVIVGYEFAISTYISAFAACGWVFPTSTGLVGMPTLMRPNTTIAVMATKVIDVVRGIWRHQSNGTTFPRIVRQVVSNHSSSFGRRPPKGERMIGRGTLEERLEIEGAWMWSNASGAQFDVQQGYAASKELALTVSKMVIKK